MNTNTIFVNNNSSINQTVNAKVLRDGTQVLVRILGTLGKNKYEGSVAGVRVQITSNKVYNKGDVFKANIFNKNGILNLVPKNDTAGKTPLTITKIQQFTQNFQMLDLVQSETLANFIKSMGMIPDNLSNMILLQMKNLGLSFNSELMNKIHNIAAKYPGKEKLAVEMLMNFLQKGMTFDADIIEELLSSLEEDGEYEDKKDVYINQVEKEDIEAPFSAAEIKAFFENLINFESENKTGILSIANNLGSKKDIAGYGSWIFLPFEITEKNEKVSGGYFRLLLSKEKKLIKFCIEHNKKNTQQLLVLEFKNNRCSKIKLNQNEDDAELNSEKLVQKLKDRLIDAGFNEIEVSWEHKEKLSGNCFGMEDFFMVDGEV